MRTLQRLAVGAALLLWAGRPALALALEEAGSLPAPAPAPDPAPAPPRLAVDLPAAALTTGGLLLGAGLASLGAPSLTPPDCRWCEPGPLDRWGRQALRWQAPSRAAAASDLLVAAIPAGAATTLGLMALRAGGPREAAEDLVVAGEAVAVAALLTPLAKAGVARLRPDAWGAGRSPSLNDRHAFWSGHTALAFSAAAATTQVARLRGRPGWGWLAAATFTGAVATGWLRLAGDQHWLTDVLAGAAVGTAAGLGVPPLVLRPAEGASPGLALAPIPGGLVLRF